MRTRQTELPSSSATRDIRRGSFRAVALTDGSAYRGPEPPTPSGSHVPAGDTRFGRVK